MQHEAAETARIALSQSFTAYGDKHERVEVFKYLGQLLAYDDNNTQAMRANLAKARKSWGQVSRVLRAENALPKVCGMFYEATVHAVLLFGCMSGKVPTRNLDGKWKYPCTRPISQPQVDMQG